MNNQELLIKHLKLLQDSCEDLYNELAHSNSQLLAQADNILTEAEILELIVNGRYTDLPYDYEASATFSAYEEALSDRTESEKLES